MADFGRDNGFKITMYITRDDGPEHGLCADQPSQIPSILESKAIALRLVAESQQAAFLADFCPVPSVPFLAIIK